MSETRRSVTLLPGRSHGKRDRDGYVCHHAVCSSCRNEVYKVWVGNAAGLRYVAPELIEKARSHECCRAAISRATEE